MIVQPAAPCRVRYRLRSDAPVGNGGKVSPVAAPPAACPMHASSAANAIKTEAAQAGFSASNAENTLKNQTKTLRIIHDAQLCQGHAVCQGEAPDYFFVDASSVLHIKQAVVAAGDEAQVRRAVHYCPNGALRLEAVQAESAGLA